MAKLRKGEDTYTRYMNVSGNMFPCFIATDRRKNYIERHPQKGKVIQSHDDDTTNTTITI